MVLGPVLVIRQAQWEAFERDVAREAALRLQPGLRGAALRAACARLDAALDRGLALGLRGPDALARFAGLDQQLGEGFEEALPWARAILGRDGPPEKKLAALETRAADEASGDETSPPSASASAPAPSTADGHPHAGAALEHLATRLTEGRRLYALVDGASPVGLRADLEAGGAPGRCLFHGVPPEVEAASPWLFDLTDHDWLCEPVVRRGLGRGAGLLVLTAADLEALEKHLRHFLRVKKEDGAKLLFRFYDPRVLRVYLRACTPDELAAFFGPIDELWLEDRDPDTLLGCSRGGGGLIVTAVDLARGASSPATA
jgi:hypothetical protein